MEDLFRRLLAGAAAPAPVPAPLPEIPVVEKFLQRLVAESQIRQPALVVASEPAGVETLLRSLLSGHLAPVQQPQQGPFLRDWNVVVCFSCGKAGHSATRCPALDDTFPFMLHYAVRDGLTCGGPSWSSLHYRGHSWDLI